MDGPSKILTVSYGTFSCTLEGFDDPLGAMRDIAEYFRDLAADDRYFGAEPPTPDVDLLQSLAEKEVNRRVEARLSDHGVALRQVEQAPAPEIAGPDETAEAAPVADPEAAADTADAPEAAMPAAVEADAAPGAAEPGASAPEANDPETAEEDPAEIAARVVSAARAPEPAAAADTPDTGTGPLTFNDDFLMADEPEDVLAVDPGARVSSDGPAESVAEKLRRIRAVVSRNIDAHGPSARIESAQVISDSPRDRAQTRTIEDITADLAEDEAGAEEIPLEDEAEAWAADAAEEETIEAVAPAAEVPEADPEEPDARHEEAQEDAAEAEDPAGTEAFDEMAEAADAHPEDRFEVTPAPSVRDEIETRPLDEETDPGAALPLSSDASDQFDLAEASFEAELQSAVAAAETEDLPEAPAEARESDDEAARRISEIIGSVTARMADDEEDGGFEAEEGNGPEAQLPRPGARVLSRPLGAEEDQDVGRLMDETDSKLNEDDVVRRRRVISQMRAAVAATKADRLVTRHVPRETLEEEERSAYRDDLSHAVRPQTTMPLPEDRPVSGPPLVLVSSQRVDDGFEEIGRQSADLPEDFAEFAQAMGAEDLDDLLEAAAAYTVFGEGQPSFTRPEIMKRVAAVDPTIRMSREESLRSFGQLLRTGTFRKLDRGQFTIDQKTRFNPNQQAVGE